MKARRSVPSAIQASRQGQDANAARQTRIAGIGFQLEAVPAAGLAKDADVAYLHDMDFEQFPRLVYLLLLLTAVGGWFIAENRASLGRSLRMFLAWGLIFLGVVAVYGLWGDIRRDLVPRQSVLSDGLSIHVPRGPGGHFFLQVDVNGTPVDFIVDTGATEVVLSLEDARRAGFDPDSLAFLGTARTANGPVKTAFATADVMSLGPVRFNRVRVAVNSGDMDDSLLGMSFLSRFERLEISDDGLILTP